MKVPIPASIWAIEEFPSTPLRDSEVLARAGFIVLAIACDATC